MVKALLVDYSMPYFMLLKLVYLH